MSKEPCKNCHYFDNEKHKIDSRTKHAGLCKKFSEIVFLTDSCKQFFSITNLPEKSIFEPKPQQYKLF